MLEKYHIISFIYKNTHSSDHLDLETLDNDAGKEIETDMKNKYLSYWRHSMQNSKKLDFFKVFKNEYPPCDYFTHLRNFPERRHLVKFK